MSGQAGNQSWIFTWQKKELWDHEIYYRAARHYSSSNIQYGDPNTRLIDQPQVICLTRCSFIIKLASPQSEDYIKHLGAEKSHQNTTEEDGSAHIGSISSIGEGREGGREPCKKR